MEELKALFRSVQSLANSELSDEKPPIGCSILTVSDKIEVHLVLKVSYVYYCIIVIKSEFDFLIRLHA